MITLLAAVSEVLDSMEEHGLHPNMDTYNVLLKTLISPQVRLFLSCSLALSLSCSDIYVTYICVYVYSLNVRL